MLLVLEIFLHYKVISFEFYENDATCSLLVNFLQTFGTHFLPIDSYTRFLKTVCEPSDRNIGWWKKIGHFRTISLKLERFFSQFQWYKTKDYPVSKRESRLSDILFNRKRNAATDWYLFRCELAAVSSRRQIDRAGRRRLRDRRCRVRRGIDALGFATLATAIEIR